MRTSLSATAATSLRNGLNFLLFCCFANGVFSQSNIQQSLSVNSIGASADASAQLDVSATDKGMLVPRMTTAQRGAITSPAAGLLVFDTTTGSFWFFNGTAWTNIAPGNSLADADGDTKIQVEESPDEDIIRFDLGGMEHMVLRKNASGVARLELPTTIENTFVGQSAGISNTTGASNTAIGREGLFSNTTGAANTALGGSALRSNISGTYNTAIGEDALFSNTTGNHNTATGEDAMRQNTTGGRNTAQGESALNSNTTGSANVAVGAWSLYRNTIKNNLVAIGDSALYNNGVGANATQAIKNTAVGSKALYSNALGSDLVAVGDSALFKNGAAIGFPEHANRNTAVGSKAMRNNEVGYENTAVGYKALEGSYGGFGNTVVGAFAMRLGFNASESVAIGMHALSDASSGGWNTAAGVRALMNNSSGSSNSAFGKDALLNAYSNANTAVGKSALQACEGGTENSGVGYNALMQNISGDKNSALGSEAFFNSSNLDNTTCIGYNSGKVTNASNRIEIGNTSVSFIGGQVNWSTYSDARIKTQVQENVPGLDFITRLRPVTYHLDIHKQNDLCFRGKKEIGEWEGMYDIEQKQMTGFIAQEVEAAARAVGYDFSGVEKGADEVGMYSIRYAEFVPPLVRAVQELEAENATLKTQVSTLTGQLEKIAAALQSLGVDLGKN